MAWSPALSSGQSSVPSAAPPGTMPTPRATALSWPSTTARRRRSGEGSVVLYTQELSLPLPQSRIPPWWCCWGTSNTRSTTGNTLLSPLLTETCPALGTSVWNTWQRSTGSRHGGTGPGFSTSSRPRHPTSGPSSLLSLTRTRPPVSGICWPSWGRELRRSRWLRSQNVLLYFTWHTDILQFYLLRSTFLFSELCFTRIVLA